jgi:hypothetical protein
MQGAPNHKQTRTACPWLMTVHPLARIQSRRAIVPTLFEKFAVSRGYDLAAAVSPNDIRIYADVRTQDAFDAWIRLSMSAAASSNASARAELTSGGQFYSILPVRFGSIRFASNFLSSDDLACTDQRGRSGTSWSAQHRYIRTNPLKSRHASIGRKRQYRSDGRRSAAVGWPQDGVS